jgi:hypothetical protein
MRPNSIRVHGNFSLLKLIRGNKTVCVSHYERMRKNQITITGNETNLPLKPAENTELNYLNKRREKNERLAQENVSFEPKKKLKTFGSSKGVSESNRDPDTNGKFVLTLNK